MFIFYINIRRIKIYKVFNSHRWLVATGLEPVGLEAWWDTEIQMRHQDPFLFPVSLFCSCSVGFILKDAVSSW